MLSITASSIVLTSRPRPGPITQSWKDPANPGSFSAQYDLATAMEAVGSVTFAGTGPGTGWSIGFMQAISLIDWAIYRAPAEAGGSVLVRNGCTSGGPGTVCFDAERPGLPYQRAIGAQTALVGRSGALPCARALPARPGFPLTLEVALQDQPEWFHAYLQVNAQTKAVSPLSEARAEITLCAALVAIDPAGARHFLQNVTWVVRWHNRFTFNFATRAITNQPVGHGNACTVGPVRPGAPADPRFVAVFTNPGSSNCNIDQNRASSRTREETAGWTNFDVPR